MVSAGHVGGTRAPGIVSNAAEVIWMSVVRGMRGVGEVFEMCMCLAQGGVGGEGVEWIRGLGIGLYQSCENRGNVGWVSVFGWRWCGWCRWGVGMGLRPGSGGGGVMSV